MKRTQEQLEQTPRMYFFEGQHLDVNSTKGLAMLIADHVKKDHVIAEIGSFSGVSSEMFAQKCKELHCIDAWTPYPEIVDVNIMKKAEANFDEMSKNYKNVIKVKAFSQIAVRDYPDHFFDLVYIDADHDYERVKKDILEWLPKIKKGGVIAGHDYRYCEARYCKVYEAVEDLFGGVYKIEKYPDSSWAIRLKS